MSIGLLYFAMVDSGEPYNEVTHSREDLEVFNVKIREYPIITLILYPVYVLREL